MKTFHYRKARQIAGWGCRFDSLTELKFAVSILEEYEFLRAFVSIYYHPRTRQPSNYIRKYFRRYTPDFLVRHKQTGEATLVEIKPRAFENDPQLLLSKEVAENYIRWKNYDWQFKVIYDDQVILTAEQWEEFEQCRKLKSKEAHNAWFEEYNNRIAYPVHRSFSTVPGNSNIEFVMFGTRTNRKEGR
jgi:hypothetical protein